MRMLCKIIHIRRHIFDVHLVVCIKKYNILDITYFSKLSEKRNTRLISSAMLTIDQMIDKYDKFIRVLFDFLLYYLGHGVRGSIIYDKDLAKSCSDYLIYYFTNSNAFIETFDVKHEIRFVELTVGITAMYVLYLRYNII